MADKNFYINFDRGTRVNSDGSQDASQALLYYQEVPSWTIRFIDESQAVVDLSAVTSWSSAVDDDFDSASTPWVRILNADIDSTDSANGVITIPVDSNTVTFQAGIGTSEYKSVYYELKGLDASANQIAYVRFTILAKNTLDPAGGTPPDPVGLYYTKVESDAKYATLMASGVTGNIVTVASDDDVQDSGTSLSSILDGVVYKGQWNATTNTPTLADGDFQGNYYIVSVAGTQDLGSGSITYAVKDWVINNGTIWEKVDNTDAGLVDPMTTRGDMIVRDASNVSARLGVGTIGQVLGSDGTDISWGATTTGTVTASGTPVANDFAKFTSATDIAGRSYAETKQDLSLGNVENTALSTWVGSANVTTLGTVTTGTLSTGVIIPCEIGFAASDEDTALEVGTAKLTFRTPYAMTVTSVKASLTGAGSTSGTTTIDINEGGTTILSTELTIDFGDKTSVGASTPPVISDSALASDAEITIDIDAVTGGADETGLKVWLIGTRTI